MVDRDHGTQPPGFGRACAAIARAIIDSLPLETSLPGVFAAGDVRHRSSRGDAAAVADGANAARAIHDYLSGA